MKISKLEYQKMDPNRVNVYVDGQFIAGIDANDILKLDLYNGREITTAEQSKIIEASQFGKIFNNSLNFLSYRPRSEWEMRTKLKGEDKETVEKVIAKLKTINQINDEDFARWFALQRQTFRPEGKRAIKFELSRKGVDRKIIDKVLSQETDGAEQKESELELATRAALKKVRLLTPRISDKKSEFAAKIKLQQFLLGRGFDFDTVKEVVEKLLKKGYN